MKRIFLFAMLLLPLCSRAQTTALAPQELYNKLREKLNAIQDYTASVRVKVDFSFMKILPQAGKLYFKNSDKLCLNRGKGISFLPKSTTALSFSNAFASGQVSVLDVGAEQIGDVPVRVLKIVPEEDGEIVLTKAWVDERRMLVLRTQSTTRDNGTIRLDLEYGKFVAQSLPDRITITMDVKDFKIPKSVTMDYDDGRAIEKQAQKAKAKKGTTHITYLSYQINTGLSDAVFANKPQ